MNYKSFINLSVFLIIFFTVIGLSAEGDKNQKGSSLSKTTGSPSRTHFNINNISTWIFNNLDSDISPTGNSGFIFPKGSNKAAVFETGFIWGATVNGERRVGGSTYNQGVLPGRIDENGNREDTALDHVRIFRVRTDWATGNVGAEIADEGVTEAEVRAQYEKDWNEWPAIYGAPYEDVDGNGAYDAAVDVPGFPGADQTIWFVSNDLDPATTRGLYGSDPMGVEIQTTVWGYAKQGALGSTMFRKYKIINKSVDTFDSMYVALWSDVDLGGAGDDYSGCDVDLSLGFTYNGDSDDAQYGKTVPALGFDFFQGPIVPGEPEDVAIFDNKPRPGFKNLPMSAHFFFINSDAVYSDPTLGDYVNGTLQMHNLFRGKISTTGEPFVDPTTGEQTKFTLSGDPVTGSGWVDGLLHPPGDRRQGLVAGPFTMAVGDTQEVVVAEIAAGAFGNVDRISAIQLLKFYDQEAQSAYDNFFQIPPSPEAPIVNTSELENEAILTWSADAESKSAIEDYNQFGYTFQGYVVYQFPSEFASIQDAKMIATFDIIDGVGKVIGPGFDETSGVVLDQVLKFGGETGISRSLSLNADAFNAGLPLNNGSKYYFAVSSYAVNEDLTVVPNVLESPIRVVEVIPHSPDPGFTITGNRDDLLELTHATGVSQGQIAVKVMDPTKVTGIDYTMFFHTDVDTNSVTLGETLWGLKDPAGSVLHDNYTLFAPDAKGIAAPPVLDGLEVRVEGPNAGILDWDYDGNRWISGVNWGGGWLFGGLDNGFNFFGSELTAGTDFYNVQLQFPGDAKFSDAADKSAEALAATSQTDQPEFWSKGQSYRRDLGYPAAGVADIPFAAYDMESTPPRRLNICIVEDANDGAANLLWDMGWDGAGFADLGGREYIFIMDSDYDEGASYDDVNWGPAADVLYAIWPKNRGSRSYLLATYTLDIIAADVLTAEDTYTFTAPQAGYSATDAKEDVKDINVFPNPYYGTHTGEINKYQRFVTFNHLPPKATMRVFNLAGQLIKTIEKDDATQFAKWDLTNENSLPAASGMYVVYIDMPELGETKILKVAIIQETQILDRF